MNNTRPPWWVYVVSVLLLLLVGVAIGWRAHPAQSATTETYAASAVQSDGSLILERKPNASAVAPMQIPKGTKVERIAQLRIQPKPAPSISSAPNNCPPVTVDLALVRQADQTQRVIANSPDGLILGGVDIPVTPIIAATQPKWAAGLSYDDKQHAGAWLDRDIGQLVVGGGIRQSDQGLRKELRIGWRF